MSDIQAKQVSKAGQHILYDVAMATKLAIEPLRIEWFDREYWRLQGFSPVAGSGRGTTLLFQHRSYSFVLRHYHRGGLPAKISKDLYLWRGLEGSRAWREWRLLATLYALGLPVCRPMAAHVRRQGFVYTADLITHRIPHAQPLSSVLAQSALGDTVWRRLGKILAEFHRAGADHADLNAHNILVDGEENFYLIDFDHSKLRTLSSTGIALWQENNLSRLFRSLRKLNRLNPKLHFDKNNWKSLLSGYQS